MKSLSRKIRSLATIGLTVSMIGTLLLQARADDHSTPTTESLVERSTAALYLGCAASGCRSSNDAVRWSSVTATDIGSVFAVARR